MLSGLELLRYLKKIYISYKNYGKKHWEKKTSLDKFLSNKNEASPKEKIKKISFSYIDLNLQEKTETAPGLREKDLYQNFRLFLHDSEIKDLGILKFENLDIDALGSSDIKKLLSNNYLNKLTLRYTNTNGFDFLEYSKIKHIKLVGQDISVNSFNDILRNAKFSKIEFIKCSFWKENHMDLLADLLKLTSENEEFGGRIIVWLGIPLFLQKAEPLHNEYEEYIKNLPYVPLEVKIPFWEQPLWINDIIEKHNEEYL